jgi:hypothetical protein
MGTGLRKVNKRAKVFIKGRIKGLFRLSGYDLVRQNSYEDYREYIPLALLWRILHPIQLTSRRLTR